MIGAQAARFAFFFAMWLAVAGWQVKDLAIGLATAAAATLVSLSLIPPAGGRIRLGPLAILARDFLRGSLFAGVDVARRALSPTVELHPGFVPYVSRLREGVARDAFCAFASLQPGALPTGASGGEIAVHALDIAQPIAQNLERDESIFARAFGYD